MLYFWRPGEAVQREAVRPGGAAASSQCGSAENPRDRGPGGGAAEVAGGEEQRCQRQAQANGGF